MPLLQTLYAMILMNKMSGYLGQTEIMLAHGGLLFGLGLAGGLGQLFSAWMQGKIGAGAVRCLSDGGQGMAFIIIAMGIAETVGIFTLAFLFTMMPKAA